MDTIAWSKLGSPTTPGNVRVEGLGLVKITQEKIDLAKAVGGDPHFELTNATSKEDIMRRYLLGLMR